MNEVAGDTRKPTHRAYFVKGQGETARWLDLGAVWAHKDGNGFDVVLDSLPVGGFSGRITIRSNETRAEALQNCR